MAAKEYITLNTDFTKEKTLVGAAGPAAAATVAGAGIEVLDAAIAAEGYFVKKISAFDDDTIALIRVVKPVAAGAAAPAAAADNHVYLYQLRAMTDQQVEALYDAINAAINGLDVPAGAAAPAQPPPFANKLALFNRYPGFSAIVDRANASANAIADAALAAGAAQVAAAASPEAAARAAAANRAVDAATNLATTDRKRVITFAESIDFLRALIQPTRASMISRVLSSNTPSALLVLPDKRIAVGNNDGSIDVWRAPVAPEEVVPPGTTREFHVDGNPLPVAGAAAPAPANASHTGSINAIIQVKGTGNNYHIITGGQDGLIKIWPNPLAANPLFTLKNQNGDAIISLLALPSGNIISGDITGNIRLWNIQAKLSDNTQEIPQSSKLVEHGAPVSLLHLLADGSIVSANDNTIKLWSRDLARETVIQDGNGNGTSLMATVNGVLITTSGGEIKIWPTNLTSGKRAKEGVEGHDSRIKSILTFPNNTLVTIDEDNKVKLWTVSNAANAAQTRVSCLRANLRSGVFKTLINIAGEEVQVEEAGFNRNQHHNKVSFSEKYFPDATGEFMQCAKNTFMMVFGSNKEVNDNNPIPPCKKEDRELILGGLRHRYATLTNDIISIKQNGGVQDGVHLRAKILHLERLRLLIMGMEENAKNKNCNDYNESGGLLGFGIEDTQLDEQFRELIRKFVYVIIQKSNPMKNVGTNYGLTDAEVANLVKEVSRVDTGTQPAITSYVQKWAEEKNERVPSVVGSVLGATGDVTTIQALLKKQNDAQTLNGVLGTLAARLKSRQTGGGEGMQEGGGLPDAVTTEIQAVIQGSDEPSIKTQRVTDILATRLDECSERAETTSLQMKTDKIARDKLQQQLLDAEKQLEVSTRNSGECVAKLSECDTRIGASKGEAAAAQTEIKLLRVNLNNQLLGLKTTTDNLIKQKSDLQAALAAFQQVMDEKNKALSAAEVSKAVTAEELQAIRMALENAYNQNEALSGTFDTLSKALGTSTAEAVAAQQPAAAAAAQPPPQPQTGGATSVEELLASISKDLADLKKESVDSIVEVGKANMEKEGATTALTLKMSSLQERLDLLNTLVPNEKNLRQEIDTLNKKVLELGQTIEQKDKEIAAKVGEQVADKAREEASAKTADASIQTKEAELTRIQTELTAKTQELDTLRTTMVKDVASLKEQLAKAQADAKAAMLDATIAKTKGLEENAVKGKELEAAKKNAASKTTEVERLRNLATLANNANNAITASTKALVAATSKGAADTATALTTLSTAAKANNNITLANQIQAIADKNTQVKVASDAAKNAGNTQLAATVQNVVTAKNNVDSTSMINVVATGNNTAPVAASPAALARPAAAAPAAAPAAPAAPAPAARAATLAASVNR